MADSTGPFLYIEYRKGVTYLKRINSLMRRAAEANKSRDANPDERLRHIRGVMIPILSRERHNY